MSAAQGRLFLWVTDRGLNCWIDSEEACEINGKLLCCGERKWRPRVGAVGSVMLTDRAFFEKVFWCFSMMARPFGDRAEIDCLALPNWIPKDPTPYQPISSSAYFFR